MPRFSLNADDLANVRVSPAWGPFSEAIFSLRLLNGRPASPLVTGWRQAVCGPLDLRATKTNALRLLAPTYPVVDLHTVVGETGSIDEALETLEGAPARHVRSELAPLLVQSGVAPDWVRRWLCDLSDGDRRARRELVMLVGDYYRSMVEPYWQVIRRYLEAEWTRLSRTLADAGVGELLNSLHPLVRWRPPYLEVAESAAAVAGNGQRSYASTGRSFVVVPSVFAVGGPHVFISAADEGAPAVLVYPALRTMEDAAQLWAPDLATGQSALGRLLGPTRARVLATVASSCTTSELARQLDVAPATASHHVGALRDCGLIASSRNGTMVLHRLTPLGAALLDGAIRHS